MHGDKYRNFDLVKNLIFETSLIIDLSLICITESFIVDYAWDFSLGISLTDTSTFTTNLRWVLYFTLLMCVHGCQDEIFYYRKQ